MLDSTTKSLINSARDILVGKVPDPKSQIEQITLALIYKFMDDMDRETVEKLKGKPKFFAGDFAKYSWRNIFNPTLGGHEMLALYAEALEKMNTNPGIHPFFREIFKNAFLPYRSPETLKLFLKTINEFNYDHSENLGNAYEYLLSILGTQGDAGQFRTPRHIIDFIVKVIDPQKHETILDPACGTAGFLLSAYKHILSQNTSGMTPTGDGPLCPSGISPKGERAATQRGVNGDLLTPDDRTLLATNLTGYDIDPNMERFALVNMFLHGFVTPQIHEYDTLSSQDRWNEYYDVILANPPFMSPKGGIRPHNRFSVKSNRSEVLFVDYIAEHLAAGGRAGVIVPEGIIFQSGTAYKSLRKMLVEENYLVGVISLPAGVFNPYSGVKTSILWLDKTLAKKTDNILFVKISSDGFDLGAQRRSVKENDLTDALQHILAYKQALVSARGFNVHDIQNFSLIENTLIVGNSEYNLSGDKYATTSSIDSEYEWIELSKIAKEINDGNWIESKDQSENGIRLIQTGNVGIGEYLDKGDKSRFIDNETFKKLRCKEVFEGDVLVSRLPDPVGRACLVPRLETRAITAVDCSIIRFDRTKILPELFVAYTKGDDYYKAIHPFLTGASRRRISRSNLEQIKIPVPSLSIQQELVSEIESYQKIIDGARQVVENYKPRIEVDPEWEIVELGDICGNLDGKRVPVTKSDRAKGIYPYYGASGIVDYVEHYLFDEDLLLVSEDGANLLARVTPIAFSVSGKIWVNNHAHVLKFASMVTQKFVELYLNSISIDHYVTGAAQPKLNQKAMNSITIPLPDLSTQRRIVEQIEREQALVRASKELVEVFEGKVRERVKGVWGQ